MEENLVEPKLLDRSVGNQLHLVLRHGFVRFVIDCFNLTAVFQFSDHSPKIDNCARRKADILRCGGSNAGPARTLGRML